MRKHLLAILFLAAAPLASARAQVFDLFPTDGGGAWQVSCVRLTANPLAPDCDAGYVDATRVTATPSGWASVPVTGPGGDAYYIATNGSATLWSEVPNELDNYQYTFKTTFNNAGGLVTALSLDLFRLDNYFVGWSVNGSAFSGTGLSPTGANVVNTNYWETPFVLDIAGANFVEGLNTLELRVLGNGRTDAILAQGRYSVPEPASLALLASGLVFLGVQARRRRNG